MNQERKEEFKLAGEEVLKQLKELIREGNVRKIIIQNEEGKEILSMPLTWGAIGAVVAPALAVVGAVAGLLTKCTLIVVKEEQDKNTENKTTEV